VSGSEFNVNMRQIELYSRYIRLLATTSVACLRLAGKQLVHRIGASTDDGPQLMPVDRLGDGRGTVANQARYLFD